MKVTIMLADFAQVVNGKLYIMGGGWSLIGPQPSMSAVAVKIEIPWTETNRKHSLKLELLDTEHHSVIVPTPIGESPVVITGDFEVGRPAGLIPGTPIDVPMAFPIGPLPLKLGERYVWKLSIDGETNANWEVAFSTRTAPQVQAAGV
jgi:hypothetical protein